ncbi:LOW QUALITY PROTEIN: pleckstrin homology domain-containing family G member 4B-like [Morus bassanus]
MPLTVCLLLSAGPVRPKTSRTARAQQLQSERWDFVLERGMQANYSGLIFYYEGWPLCIHENMTVRLAHLQHPVCLKLGDFYLKAVPAGKQLAKLVLKCLYRCGQGMEGVAIPETMYGIFTVALAENVNCERENFPLQSWLLVTDPAYRTPWTNIVNPVFVPTTETILHNYSSSLLFDQLISNNTDVREMTQTMEGNSSCDSSISNVTGSTMIEITLMKNCNSLNNGVSSSIHASESRLELECIQHIMDEMITTERMYVTSLGYITNNYFPEIEKNFLPQDLGKKNIIFGNLKKLFLHKHFLKELEHCRDFPLSVSHCFLKHEEQMGMYALYSKNKPQSDALLTSRSAVFKNKQWNPGDKLDLASYLLKPIQRMSKYALLLKDMIKEDTKAQKQELSDLRAAKETVKFQLCHGNNLLAIDVIQGCDVNLKEQEQLCQDKFIVCCGRKKRLRHVFLFEDFILFSKRRKFNGGYGIYMYKQSFKTAKSGMTKNVGDRGLRFEIWFRRRSPQDTYILQANAETKITWTNIIGNILWRQALSNRDMQSVVSMGIDNKPFMDIKPSEAAIGNPAIDYIIKGKESRSQASIAISVSEHSTPLRRPHSTITSSSTSPSSNHTSSSILSPLSLHVCSRPSCSAFLGLPFFHWSYGINTCTEEDELGQERGSQPLVSKWISALAEEDIFHMVGSSDC